MSVYLITGVSGYIGSMLTQYLLKNDPCCEIVAPVRNIQKARERLMNISVLSKTDEETAQDWFRQGRLHLLLAELCDRSCLEQLCDDLERAEYIVHCASITHSAKMLAQPVEVTDSIISATRNVLEIARRCKIKSMVYLSSMEVYGDIDCRDGHQAQEEEAGDGRMEILSARSCYPLGKRLAENLCYNYFQEYGVPVRIARLSQTFGRGVPPSDGRVFAQFARAVKSGTDIVLHTEGNSMGNYCGIDDTISGILVILKRGEDGEAYNIVNDKNTMTIREMAQLVASQVADGRIGVRFELAYGNRYGYAADTGLRLSGEKLVHLGWKPEKRLADMYREMLTDSF